MSHEITINNNIIHELLDKYEDKTINGKTYKFLGKGQEGVVYEMDNKAIKIYYSGVKIDSVIKEFYTVGLLQQVEKVNINIVKVYNYYLRYDNPVLLMDVMDNNLHKWSDKMIRNEFKLSDQDLEMYWMSMIFQVSYGLLYLNKYGILHNDSQPKNILYNENNNRSSNNKYHIYEINNKKYKVNINYNFKIADFGNVKLRGSKLSNLTDDEINEKLQNREDLYDLSRIIMRLIVDYSIKVYNYHDIMKYINKNKDYHAFYIEQKEEIYKNLVRFPEHVKRRYLSRSLRYYGIENNILNKNRIIKKYNLIIPSKKVLETLENLTNPDYSNIFDMFDIFRV